MIPGLTCGNAKGGRMKRAGLYARISEDHEGLRLGVGRQIADSQELIERKGWRLVDTYVDNDVSATRGKPRPEYQRLLADMESGELDAVAVWALDRLHRRPAELETFISLAERCGVALASVSGEHDLATPDGRMYARMLGAVAAGEAEKISHRVSRKQQQLREQGKPFSGGIRPYGYRPDRMTVIPQEAEIIREMATRVLAGESVGEIVRDLNRRRIQTVSQWMVKDRAARGRPGKTEGHAWSRTSVRTLLSRPRIAGLLTYKGEVTGEAAWPAILDRETFDRLQVALSNRRPQQRMSNSRKYLLSGIATCGTCGTGLQVGHQSNGAISYKCPTQRHVTRHMGKVDAYVVRSYWEHQNRLGEHIARLAEQMQETDEIGAEIQRLRLRLDEAADGYANDDMTAEQLTTISRRLRERIEALEAERPSPVSVPLVMHPAMPWETFEEQWKAMELSQQRFLLASEIKSLTVLAPKRRGGNVFDTTLIVIEWPELPDLRRIKSA